MPQSKRIWGTWRLRLDLLQCTWRSNSGLNHVRLACDTMQDAATCTFDILRKEGVNYLSHDDFKSMLAGILLSHPGLEFLTDTPEFQDRSAACCDCALPDPAVFCPRIAIDSLVMTQVFGLFIAIWYRAVHHPTPSGIQLLCLSMLPASHLGATACLIF